MSRRVAESVAELQPFARIWRQDGTVEMGGDFAFCERIRALGWRIWTHADYVCDHIQTLPLLETIERIGQLFRAVHGD